MDIREVEEILGLFRALKAPKHVLITDEHIREQVDGLVFYRGLQPTSRRDVIVLSRDADESTPIHETIHAQLGLDEPATELLTRILMVKYRLLQRFPLVKELVKKPIRYEECKGCTEFPQAHSPKYAHRIRHFVRKL